MTCAEADRMFWRIASELKLPASWRLEFDQASRRFGSCRYGSQRITLSQPLVELNTPEAVEQTIRHEIAHALVGPGHGHNAVWKAMCLKCGGDGKRCYDVSVIVPEVKREYPWKAVCPVCHQTHKRLKAPQAGAVYRCGACYRTPKRAQAVLAFSYTAKTVMSPSPSLAKPSQEQLETLMAVLKYREQGLGYVAIDAKFGIYGKKGWWSWKLVRDAQSK